MDGRGRRCDLEQTVIQEVDHLPPGPWSPMSKWLAIDQRPKAAAIGNRDDDPALRGENAPGFAEQLPRAVSFFQSVKQEYTVE